MQLLLVIGLVCLMGLAQADISDDSAKYREKRLIWLNSNWHAPVVLGGVIRIPIGLAYYAVVSTVSYRSLSSFSEEAYTITELYNSEDFYWEPAYELELNKIQAFFSFIKVSTISCQEKIICELSTAPEDYYPVSTLVLRELRHYRGPYNRSQNSLYWRLKQASVTTFTDAERDCDQLYPECDWHAPHRLNLPLLKLIQYLAAKIGLSLME